MLITLAIIFGSLIFLLVGLIILMRSPLGEPVQRRLVRFRFVQRLAVRSMRREVGAEAAGASDLEVMLSAMGPEGRKLKAQLRSMSPAQRKKMEKALWATASAADPDVVVAMAGRAERRKAEKKAGGRQAKAARKAAGL